MSLSDTLLPATQRYLRAYPSAALCVGITHRGVHHVRTLCHAGAPPVPNALYELGFLTQVFTGSLLALLVDRGEARLDTPLADILPRPLLPDERAGRITLGQLATHTSGLPRDPPNLKTPGQNPDDPYGHYGAELFGAFLRGYAPQHPPPRAPAASIIGMGVLGHVLSRRVRLNYGHAVRDLLCTPLGLSDTTCVRLSEDQERRLRVGHSARGMPRPAWTFPALPGAGALRSTVPDLLRFLDANLGRGEAGLCRALRLAHAPSGAAGSSHPGLGWSVRDIGGHPGVMCSSVTGGFAGFIGFSVEADAGVVVLSDHSGSWLDSLLRRVPVERLGLELLSKTLRERDGG